MIIRKKIDFFISNKVKTGYTVVKYFDGFLTYRNLFKHIKLLLIKIFFFSILIKKGIFCFCIYLNRTKSFLSSDFATLKYFGLTTFRFLKLKFL